MSPCARRVPAVDRRQALQVRLKAIPPGDVARVARESGIGDRRMRSLREGKSLNVQLDTLGALADALHESISQMLGEGDAPRAPIPTVTPGRVSVDQRQVERLARLLAEAGAVLRKIAPDEKA